MIRLTLTTLLLGLSLALPVGAQADFTADFAQVPEPSSLILVTVSVGAAIFWSRMRRR